MECAWGVHGVCMGCAWGVHGVCMGCAWSVHGVCMGCAWGVCYGFLYLPLFFLPKLQQFLNSRRMTEAGPLELISEDEDEEQRGTDIKLPGVRRGGVCLALRTVCQYYSGTPLIRTPLGQERMPLLKGCPYFRGQNVQYLGIAIVSCLSRCPYFRVSG